MGKLENKLKIAEGYYLDIKEVKKFGRDVGIVVLGLCLFSYIGNHHPEYLESIEEYMVKPLVFIEKYIKSIF